MHHAPPTTRHSESRRLLAGQESAVDLNLGAI